MLRLHSRSNCHRGLTTLFGDVVVHRRGYIGKGLSHVFPLDAELNLPPDQYSHGLRQKIAEAIGKESFGEACLTIKENTGGHIPKRQAEEIGQKVGLDFDAYDPLAYPQSMLLD